MSFVHLGDAEFEHALLRSASRDLPDAGASERAWSRFATSMSGVAMTLVAQEISAPPAATSVGRRAGDLAAAKWLIVGALGGSMLTFALVRGHGFAPSPSVVPTAASATPPAIVVPPVSASSSAGVAGVSSPVRAPGPASVYDSRRRRSEPNFRDQASSLAAEVAALDAARGALDRAAPEDAFAALRRYFRDFPEGKLIPEAKVMGIEVLAAKGDRAGVSAEASRFLAHYPNAPQRTRVEQLRAEAGEN